MTATSRACASCLLAVAVAAVVSGCGAAASPRSGASATTGNAGVSPSAAAAGFAWLKPAPAPSGWLSARLPSGATIAYPPQWRPIRGDRGTASAALLDARADYLGYLNLTPQQGSETLAGWAAFRLRHNAEEGDTEVKADGAAAGLRFRTGRGTCVRDTYTSSVKTRYEEIACLVAGHRAASVVVGAAPSNRWREEQSVIERAISAMTT